MALKFDMLGHALGTVKINFKSNQVAGGGQSLKVYDVGRRSIYQDVQLFIGSKNYNILNVTIFKCSLYKIRETILH